MLTFDNEGNLVCTYQNFAEDGDKPLFKKGLSGMAQKVASKFAPRTLRKNAKKAWAATKKGAGYALKGVNTGKKSDYAINAGIRAGEGALVGATAGTIAGNLHGRSKQNKLGSAARAAASKGLKNKFLNALNKNRLNDIEKAARGKVSLTKETLKGLGIGAGAGAATGAGAGALETFLKHKGNETKAFGKGADRRKSLESLYKSEKKNGAYVDSNGKLHLPERKAENS